MRCADNTTLTIGQTSEPAIDPDLHVIVNKRRSLPACSVPSDLRVPEVERERKFELKEAATIALERMFAVARHQGVTLRLISGYRSFDRQNELHQSLIRQHGVKRAESISARPGHSEHQTGLAADIGDGGDPSTDTSERFAETNAGRWLAQHAHEYGFILRYPRGKEAVTGFRWEPWHFRFVGVDFAATLRGSELTLEEYLGVEGGDYLHSRPTDHPARAKGRGDE